MVWSCCVPYCNSGYRNRKSERSVSAHLFPREPILKEKWILAISRQGDKPGSLWRPNHWSKVCSKHFKQSDFSISTFNEILLPKVVPSIFPGYRKCRMKNKKAKRIPEKRFLGREFKNLKVRPNLDVPLVVNSEVVPKTACIRVKDKPNLYLPLVGNSGVNVLNTVDVGVQCSSEDRANLLALESGAVDAPETASVGVQVHSLKGILKENCKCVQRSKEIYELRKRIENLKTRLRIRNIEEKKRKSSLEAKVARIKEESKFGVSKALFLLEQIKNYDKLIKAYPI